MTKIDDASLNKNSKTVDQSSVTDESSFGSCEPGTHVVLQGIVWNETDKGKRKKSFHLKIIYYLT